MHRLDLEQFRTTLETGGIVSVSLVAQGGSFHIQAETRGGRAVLTKMRSSALREFRNVMPALAMLRDLGIREVRVDTRNWQPEQADLDRPVRAERKEEAKPLPAATPMQN